MNLTFKSFLFVFLHVTQLLVDKHNKHFSICKSVFFKIIYVRVISWYHFGSNPEALSSLMHRYVTSFKVGEISPPISGREVLDAAFLLAENRKIEAGFLRTRRKPSNHRRSGWILRGLSDCFMSVGGRNENATLQSTYPCSDGSLH